MVSVSLLVWMKSLRNLVISLSSLYDDKYLLLWKREDTLPLVMFWTSDSDGRARAMCYVRGIAGRLILSVFLRFPEHCACSILCIINSTEELSVGHAQSLSNPGRVDIDLMVTSHQTRCELLCRCQTTSVMLFLVLDPIAKWHSTRFDSGEGYGSVHW
jgi:hypothetical protein